MHDVRLASGIVSPVSSAELPARAAGWHHDFLQAGLRPSLSKTSKFELKESKSQPLIFG